MLQLAAPFIAPRSTPSGHVLRVPHYGLPSAQACVPLPLPWSIAEPLI